MLFFISIKAAWLPKILYECDTWICIAQMHVLSIADTTSITNFNFEKENCLDKINALPTFYKDVIFSYAKANKYPKPVTKQQSLELPLWGNKHISIYNKTTKGTTTLLFNEWTVKGIYHIRDLKFINGKLDQAFFENVITNMRDIWRQMALMKKALKPLKPLIGDHTPHIPDINNINVTKLTVKSFYKTLTEHSDTKKYYPFQVWENIIGQSCDCKAALKQKNYNVKDLKLKEFNFQVIHRILSCEINLKKWKLQDHDKCIECGNQHSILHLLYECPNSGILWRLVEECFGYSVSTYKIIFGDSEETYINFIISLICYLLYKYWLLRKNEHITLSLKYFIVNELEYRNQVYRILNWEEIQVNLNKLKHYIMLFI